MQKTVPEVIEGTIAMRILGVCIHTCTSNIPPNMIKGARSIPNNHLVTLLRAECRKASSRNVKPKVKQRLNTA